MDPNSAFCVMKLGSRIQQDTFFIYKAIKVVNLLSAIYLIVMSKIILLSDLFLLCSSQRHDIIT